LSAHSQDRESEKPPPVWSHGILPPNVRVGPRTTIIGELAFKRFYSTDPDALVIGSETSIDGAHFAIGRRGRISIGDCCYLDYAILLCESTIRIGNYIAIGWNTTIADTDFHPLSPAERIADAIACSPLGKGRARPPLACGPVRIDDYAWIGPSSTIMKGVWIGAGAWIEPGCVITRDVPPGARMIGNPAREITGAA